MRKSILISFLLAISACASLHAQTFSLITGREPVTSLDGLWRFHTGDNPAWASPDFDDSNWPLVRSDKSWTRQGYPAFNGYAWYRFKVEIPGSEQPVDLLLTRIADGYEIYANGKLIGRSGSWTAENDPVFASHRAMFPLPAAGKGPQSIQIALRVWTYRPIASWFAAGAMGPGNELGNPGLLSLRMNSENAQDVTHFINEYAYGLFAGLIGLAILALFLFRPGDKEYLWFSILLLASSTDAVLHLMLNLGSLPLPLWDVSRLGAIAISMLAALAFFSIVLQARRSFLWRTICIAVAASPLSAALIYFQWTGMGISFTLGEACILPAYLWIIAQLLLGSLRKDVSARLLVIPVALFYGFDCADITARIVWQLRGSPSLPSLDLPLVQSPFPLAVGDVIDFVFLLALLIFLVRRFSLARKEEERLAGEFEAAKSVQSLLIPAAPPITPGFAVESIYVPAQEVGGDFFQVLPGSDSSLLIVVGDVSGKGLQAAMTVSAIVGALRGCTLRAPAAVLAHLNRLLCGQIGGFVTCIATLITEDGTIAIANAGHLPPYRNGEELTAPTGLPLGIVAETSYEESRFELAPADRLTFVSDGVVEARNAKGELLGFERMTGLTMKRAEEIADAAQRWGQEDDITVLTVARSEKKDAMRVLPLTRTSDEVAHA